MDTRGEHDGDAGLRRVADAVSRLVREHAALAKAELKEDAQKLSKEAAIGLSGLPFAGAGLLLLNLAVAAWLAPRLGLPGALAAVGGVDLAIGAILGAIAAFRLSRDAPSALEGTKQELEKGREFFRTLRRDTRPALGAPTPPRELPPP